MQEDSHFEVGGSATADVLQVPPTLWATAGILSFISFIGILFNFILIFIIFIDPNVRLKRRRYYIMLNLAISDLCLSINGSPSVAYFISPTPNEFFFFTNEAACKANAFALYVASSVSALTICLLAFERYRNVVCQAKISKRNIFFYVLIFWIYSVGLALFIKYANGSKIQYQASYAYCVVPFTSDLLAVSATLLFLITHVVVLVLLVFSYCSIFKTLYQVKRDLRKWLQVDDHHIKNSNTAAAINDDEDIPNSATIINNAENSINNSNMNDIKIEMPKKAILFARHLYPRLQHVPASSSSHLAFDGTHSSTSQNHEYTYYNDSSVLTSVCSSTLDQQNHHVFSHPFPASALSVLTASPVSSFSIPTPPLTQHASTRASPLPSSTKPLLDLRERILLRKLGLFTAVYIFNWSFMIYSHIFALFTVSDTSALIGSIAVCLLHFNSVCNPVLICLTDSGIRASFLAWFNISNSTRRTRGCGGGGGRGGRITKDERGIGGEFAFTQ